MVAVCWFVVSGSRACRWRMSPRRWVCRVRMCSIGGSLGSMPKVRQGCSTDRHGRTTCRRGRRRPVEAAVMAATDRAPAGAGLGSRPELGLLRADGEPDPAPPPDAVGCRSCDPMTGEVIRSRRRLTAVRYRTKTPRPSCFTWMSRRSAGSPTVAVVASSRPRRWARPSRKRRPIGYRLHRTRWSHDYGRRRVLGRSFPTERGASSRRVLRPCSRAVPPGRHPPHRTRS